MSSTVLHGIDRNMAVMVDPGDMKGFLLTTWGKFVDDNADGLAGDVERIASDLLKRPGANAFGGGGATGEWNIRLLIGDMDAFEKWRASRQEVESLGDHEVGEACGVEGPGYIYDRACFIEINDPDVAAKVGKYGVVIENFSACSDDLGAMEWLLWEHWASTEG